MKKTILAISAIAMVTSNLFANWEMDGKKIVGNFPLGDVKTLTKAHGGNLSPITAYSDGMGVKVVSSTSMLGSAINNSAYNKLVFKYGEAAKASGLSLADQILNGDNKTVPSIQDIRMANKLKNNRTVEDETSCDDKNPNTKNDKYINNICQGILIDCNDNNPYTEDKPVNGVCTNVYSHPNLKINKEAEINFVNSSTIVNFTNQKYCKNFTLNFYAKTSEVTGLEAKGHVPGKTEQFIFSATHGGTTFDGVGVSFGINGIATYEHSSNNMPKNGAYENNFTAGKYYKITYVYKDSVPSLYINNTYISTGVKSPRDNACSPIGYGFGRYSKNVTASLKDIKIFNKALDLNEIKYVK